MHRPPAVSHTLGRSSWHFRLLSVLSGLALVAAVLLVQSHPDGIFPWIVYPTVLFFMGLAFAGWLRSATGVLQWDGQHWLWPEFADPPVRHTVLVLDFQSLMLVKMTSERNSVVWLWLEGSMGDARWLAVRRAVVASQDRPDVVVAEAGHNVP